MAARPRERALRRAGGALETAVGTLRLGAPDAPRTQLCCVDGHGRLFEWTTELPHQAATTPETRVICLAEMSAPGVSSGLGYPQAVREWYEEPPFTDASKVLAYDVLLYVARERAIAAEVEKDRAAEKVQAIAKGRKVRKGKA